MDFDILIYAVIAVVVLARLWSVFGQRNDGDEPRPNPFAAPPAPAAKDKDAAAPTGAEESDEPLRLPAFRAAPASLAGGLEHIRMCDPSFDEKRFLEGARTAFRIVVEDFGKGDLSRSARFLASRVYANFQAAIEARRAEGHVLEARIARLREAECVAARIEGTQAQITVQFVSEQENIVRDAGGRVVSGVEGTTEEITDLWIFARDLKSADPNWQLVETKS